MKTATHKEQPISKQKKENYECYSPIAGFRSDSSELEKKPKVF